MGTYQIETDQGTFEVQTDEPSDSHPDLPPVGKTKSFAEMASPYYHTALETGGALVGGVLATPGDILTGPVATAVGGGLGFAGGRAAANLLDRKLGVSPEITPSQAVQETGQDIYGGAKNEATGLAAGAVLRQGAKLIKGPLAKGYGKLAQLLSGTKAQDIARTVNEPSLVLPKFAGGPMTRGEAGQALGQAERNAGFVTENLNPETEKTATGLAKFTGKENPFIANQTKALGYFDRVSKGEELTPQEMLDAYKASQDYLTTVSRVDRKWVAMNNFKDVLQNTLKQMSPEYAQATQDFARAATGNNVTNLLPRTLTGKVSQGRVGFNALLTGAGSLGGPLGAATAFASSAPLTYGVGAAGLGVGANLAERAGASPNLLRAASSIIQGKVNGNNRETPQGNKKMDQIIKSARDRLLSSLSPDIQSTAASELPNTAPQLTGDRLAEKVGLEYFLDNNINKAKDYWIKAVKLNPNNLNARRGLERIAIKEGKNIDVYKPKGIRK